MATNYKILGQHNSAANTEATVYTVPAEKETVVSTITIANQTSQTNVSYSISVAPNGEAANDKHFIVRGSVVPAADAIALSLGLTLDSSDVVRCNASRDNVSFNIFGSEIS